MNHPNTFENKILAKDIVALGRAITLNESTRLEDNIFIDKIISKHADKLSNSIVISISGIPGVGKSTFIETLGVFLSSIGKSIAVFSIDPTSEKTQGSILGDKTRMNELSQLPNVFIRPSPSSNKLGGLGINTHRNIDLAKIAGFDIIIVETVGVGQSETIVQNLCDLFILLLMPASGDELQGIKKGIMEVADFYIIHKADGDLKILAEKSKKEIEASLQLTRSDEEFSAKIFSYSSVIKNGLVNIWKEIDASIEEKKRNQEFLKKRIDQRKFWLEETFNQLIFRKIKESYNQKISVFKNRIDLGEYIEIEEFDLD